MLNNGDLKDKYYRRENGKFRPYVEWFEWPVWALPLYDTYEEARDVLELFPNDCSGSSLLDGITHTKVGENIYEQQDYCEPTGIVCDLPPCEREGGVQESDCVD